jgi:WD40 repeat protein/serine/threonine protein kinase
MKTAAHIYAMRFIRGDSLKDAADAFHNERGVRGRAVSPAEGKVADEPDDLAMPHEEHAAARLATTVVPSAQPETSVRLLDETVPRVAALLESIEFRQLLGRFVDVCNAMEYAHSRGVLHRDLKPGNIMLGKYGETLVVDWGLAKVKGRDGTTTVADEDTLVPSSGSGSAPTQMGSVIGTPAFMPPEQAAGRLHEPGPASDVYSLGATLYYVLTGTAAFRSSTVTELLRKVQAGDFPSPRSVNRNVSLALNAICLRAMALQPSNRYSSPRALADDIERYLADEPVSAHGEPLSVRTRRWMRKHPRSVASLAATLLVGLTSAVLISAVVTGKNEELQNKNVELLAANVRETQARETASKRAERLRQTAARSLFEDGVESATAGHIQASKSNLLRAYALASPTENSRISYLRVLIDRLTQGGRLLAPPMPNNSSVRNCVFSPDGQRLATQADSEIRLWDAETGLQVGLPIELERSVNKMLFSGDGRYLATSSGSGAQLWLAQTGEAASPVLKHQEVITSIYFSPDIRFLATSSTDKSVRLWNVPTGDPLGEPLLHETAVNGVAVCPKSRYLAAYTNDSAFLWDTETGKTNASAMRHEGKTSSITFSPDGKLLATTGDEESFMGAVRLWDVPSGASSEKPIPCDLLSGCAFVLGGQQLAVFSGREFFDDGYFVKFYDLHTRQKVREWHQQIGGRLSADAQLIANIDYKRINVLNVENGNPVLPQIDYKADPVVVRFSPDGRLLVIGDGNALKLWSVHNGKSLGLPLHHLRRIDDIAFSPDGQRIAAVGGNEATLWHTDTDVALRPALDLTNWKFSPDGRYLADLRFDNVEIWDILTGNHVGTLKQHTQFVDKLAFSNDGLYLATASRDETVIVWSIKTLKPINPPIRRMLPWLSFSPDGRSLMMDRPPEQFELWNLETGTLKFQFDGIDEGLSGHTISWTRDSRKFAATTPDMTAVQIYSTDHGAALGTPFRQNGKIEDFDLSPDGQRLAIACGDASTLWNVQTGSIVGEPLKHEGQVISTKMSPNGERLATIGLDFTVRLWNVQNGMALDEPLRHESSVKVVAFSPDSRCVATGTERGVVQLWDVETCVQLGEPMQMTWNTGQIEQLVFSPYGQRLSIGSHFHAWICNVSPFDLAAMSANEIEDPLKVWTGMIADDEGNLQPLKTTELDRLRNAISHRDPIQQWTGNRRQRITAQ